MPGWLPSCSVWPVVGDCEVDDGGKVIAALADFARRSATAARVAFQLLFPLDLPPSVRHQGVGIVRQVST